MSCKLENQALSDKILVQVLLPLIFDKSFTYYAVSNIKVGAVVEVEFGRQKIWGIIIEINDKSSVEEPPAYKIKDIINIHQDLFFTPQIIEFIEKIASYNLASRGMVLKSFLNIINSNKKRKKAVTAKSDDFYNHQIALKKLSDQQQIIAEKIGQEINIDKPLPILLEGVTGSGKTEIYFKIIADLLQNQASQKPQILILLPEIALTSQIIKRFQEQFNFPPALWHSQITAKNKLEIFHGLNSGSLQILIGARSALLLPFKNLKLIIVDEEHDPSFKQEELFNFSARDMAIIYGKIAKCPVLLASATPSIESFYNYKIHKYKHFHLETKFFAKENKIDIVDLKNHKDFKRNPISPALKTAIKETLENQRQVLLFLNRRGYAPLAICNKCGNKQKCLNCDFHLVFHKSKNILACHHCGYQKASFNQCQECKDSGELISVGMGVEKILEQVALQFEDARIAMITSDNIDNFTKSSEIIEKISNREIDIIIGTQMITKGYDFKHLALVGVIDADSFFYSSDLRCTERAYQMLTQVIGRAGRHQEAGRVIIQSHNPENLIFEKIIKGNQNDFYNFELSSRQMLDLPPFARMASFNISSLKEQDAKRFAIDFIKYFPIDEKIMLMGPISATIQRVKNRHHFLVNLKTQKNVNIQKLINNVLKNIEIPKSIRLNVDIDPL